MDDQLLAEVEQLTSSTLAPEGCLLRLLPLLVGRQDGEHAYPASAACAGMAGQGSTIAFHLGTLKHTCQYRRLAVHTAFLYTRDANECSEACD